MKRTELPRAEALCAQYLNKAQRVLAAVSGGADSMCLLYFLREQGYDVSCAHFNHRLRGEEAVRDEEFVRAWCEEERIPFCSGSGDVRAHARKTGKTVEEAARDLRYAFLRETAKKLNAQLTLAHHADDNAETVLLNLVRGTDLHGLCGMRPKQGDLVRPFLEQTRAELAAYAHSHNIPHGEDRTNADPNAAARNLRSCRGFKRSTPAQASTSPQRRARSSRSTIRSSSRQRLSSPPQNETTAASRCRLRPSAPRAAPCRRVCCCAWRTRSASDARILAATS